MMIQVQYTVKGAGEFPIDMMRYDNSHPFSEEDSHKIERTFDPAEGVMLDPIRLCRWVEDQQAANYWSAHRQRWQSFGWEVVWHHEDVA
jgi:hypothetical protein